MRASPRSWSKRSSSVGRIKSLFHMQVGASRQHQAVRTIEKFATEIRPMLEQALGPLEAIGHAVQAAASE